MNKAGNVSHVQVEELPSHADPTQVNQHIEFTASRIHVIRRARPPPRGKPGDPSADFLTGTGFGNGSVGETKSHARYSLSRRWFWTHPRNSAEELNVGKPDVATDNGDRQQDRGWVPLSHCTDPKKPHRPQEQATHHFSDSLSPTRNTDHLNTCHTNRSHPQAASPLLFHRLYPPAPLTDWAPPYHTRATLL